MLNWLKLFRFGNLLIIMLTMVLTRYMIVGPMLQFMNIGIDLVLGHFDFALLVLSVVLIAAAGYAINDYFDTSIDRVNKPHDVLVGRSIKRRQAMLVHTLFNLTGVAIGIVLAWKVGLISLSIIHLLSTGMLWFYSTDFKKMPLIGNLIVSFLTALVPLIVALFDLRLVVFKYEIELASYGLDVNHILRFTGGLALFAFLTTFIREMIKDLEDVKGDEQHGAETAPVVWGARSTKMIILLVMAVCLSLLGYLMLQQFNQHDYISLSYFATLIWLPLLYVALKLLRSEHNSDYHRLSRLIKLIMLAGVGYTGLFYALLKDWI